MQKKILARKFLLITIGMIIGVLIAAYFFNNLINSQTPSPAAPASWKAYSKSSFSLSLPNGWIEQTKGDSTYYSSGKPGRTELSINLVTNKKKQDLITEVTGLFADAPV